MSHCSSSSLSIQIKLSVIFLAFFLSLIFFSFGFRPRHHRRGCGFGADGLVCIKQYTFFSEGRSPLFAAIGRLKRLVTLCTSHSHISYGSNHNRFTRARDLMSIRLLQVEDKLVCADQQFCFGQ